MKAQTLALIAITSLATPLGASAQQQHHHTHYHQVETEPSRFPNLRKAFRQIRSDLRYQAGAIRETASYIRHDLEDTIRGEANPTGGYRSQYGYRGERYPVDEYPPRTDRREYEPNFPRNAERQIPRAEVRTRQPEPEPKPRPRVFSRREESPEVEPEIVAPRELDPAPIIKKKNTEQKLPTPAPKPDLRPKPRPEPDSKATPKPEPKSPNYPSARPSDRKGFHYSPYPPFELLDTQDVEPGGLARDPGTGKIFRVPK